MVRTSVYWVFYLLFNKNLNKGTKYQILFTHNSSENIQKDYQRSFDFPVGITILKTNLEMKKSYLCIFK